MLSLLAAALPPFRNFVSPLLSAISCRHRAPARSAASAVTAQRRQLPLLHPRCSAPSAAAAACRAAAAGGTAAAAPPLRVRRLLVGLDALQQRVHLLVAQKL